MEKLTSRQQDILDTIKKLIAKNGFPPTVREIGAELGLSSSATTFLHIKKLMEFIIILMIEKLLDYFVPERYVLDLNHGYREYLKIHKKG